jgi:hypothetical protein
MLKHFVSTEHVLGVYNSVHIITDYSHMFYIDAIIVNLVSAAFKLDWAGFGLDECKKCSGLCNSKRFNNQTAGFDK